MKECALRFDACGLRDCKPLFIRYIFVKDFMEQSVPSEEILRLHIPIFAKSTVVRHYVGRSVGPSVGPSVITSRFWAFRAKRRADFSYCPCPATILPLPTRTRLMLPCIRPCWLLNEVWILVDKQTPKRGIPQLVRVTTSRTNFDKKSLSKLFHLVGMRTDCGMPFIGVYLFIH